MVSFCVRKGVLLFLFLIISSLRSFWKRFLFLSNSNKKFYFCNFDLLRLIFVQSDFFEVLSPTSPEYYMASYNIYIQLKSYAGPRATGNYQ